MLLPMWHRCPGHVTSSEPPHLLFSEGPAASPPAGTLQEQEKKQTDPRAKVLECLLYVSPWPEVGGGGFCSHAALRVPGERQTCHRHTHTQIRTHKVGTAPRRKATGEERTGAAGVWARAPFPGKRIVEDAQRQAGVAQLGWSMFLVKCRPQILICACI